MRAGPRYSAHYIGIAPVPRGPLVVAVVDRWDMTRSAVYVVIDLASPFTNAAGDVPHTYFEAYSSAEYCTVLTPSNTAIIGSHSDFWQRCQFCFFLFCSFTFRCFLL